MSYKKLEVWKKVPNYKGYEVSNKGKIRSIDKISKNGCKIKGKLFKIWISTTGYCMTGIGRNGEYRQYGVHRIVAWAFLPNPKNKREINHINGVKTDNRVENLEWCTRQENVQHAIQTGLWNPITTLCRKESEESRKKRAARMLGHIVEQSTRDKIAKSLGIPIKCIEDNKEFGSLEEAGTHYGISKGTFHRKFHAGKEINGKNFIRI